MIDRAAYYGGASRTVLGSPSTGINVDPRVKRVVALSGVNATNFFTMVDARLLPVGIYVYLYAEGFDYAVKDNTGATLFTLLAGTIAKGLLTSNATQAGVWRWRRALTLPSIASLKARYRADLGQYDADTGGALITVDATAAGRWEDQSGNGYHVSQATAGNRPLWKANQLNGHPVIRWDGVDDALRRNPFDVSQWTANVGQDITIFSVHKTTATQNGRLLSCEDGGNHFGIWPLYGDGKIYWYGQDGINIAAPGGYVNSWRIEVYRKTGTNMSIKSNGTVLLSTTVAGGSIGGAGALSIGGFDAGLENYKGDQGELIVYAASITTPQEDSVLDYLRSFWGVY